MKKSILKLAVIATAVVMLASCGSSPKGLPENDIFGKVPSIIYQYEQQDSIIRANAGSANFLNPDDELKEKFKKAELKFKQDMEKEGKRLEGRAIPFTLSEGLGYEVTSLKIQKVDDRGDVYVEYSVKLTDVSKIKFHYTGRISLSVQLINKAGEVFSNDVYTADFKIDGVKNRSDLKAGMEFSGYQDIRIYSSDAKEYVDFAKIIFVEYK